MQKDKPKSPLSPMELMLKAVEKAAQEEDNPEEYLKVADPLNRWLDFSRSYFSDGNTKAISKIYAYMMIRPFMSMKSICSCVF